MEKHILIGNALALAASLIMVNTGMSKKKKRFVFFQSIQIVLFTISNIVLEGNSGAIINVVNLARNILCYKEKLNLKAKVFLTIITTVLIYYFNNLGIIGMLPLIASIAYLWLMNIENVIKFKILNIFTCLLWTIYDIRINSYTSAFFNVATMITNIISIIHIKMGKENIKTEHGEV